MRCHVAVLSPFLPARWAGVAVATLLLLPSPICRAQLLLEAAAQLLPWRRPSSRVGGRVGEGGGCWAAVRGGVSLPGTAALCVHLCTM